MFLFSTKKAGAVNTGVRMYFNNDQVNANYSEQYAEFSGAALTLARGAQPYLVYLRVGDEQFTYGFIKRVPDGYPLVNALSTDNVTFGVRFVFRAYYWNSTANLTRIDIVADVANAIAIGSHLMIFKVRS